MRRVALRRVASRRVASRRVALRRVSRVAFAFPFAFAFAFAFAFDSTLGTCPITQSRMVDPVVASDGHSYDRSAIEVRGPEVRGSGAVGGYS